jgi:hypothetical protein
VAGLVRTALATAACAVSVIAPGMLALESEDTHPVVTVDVAPFT